MKFPRFLLLIALLFWGYETNTLIAAVPIAIVLEIPMFLTARWEFSDGDLNRIWDLCAVLLVAMGVIIASTNELAKASFQFIQYLPFAFVPIVAAQRYGDGENLKWSVFSWFLRRTPNTYTARRRADVNWVFFAVCLFATSATHDANVAFYPAMALLIAAGLYSVRPARLRLVPWVVLCVSIGVMGHFAHHGLFTLQGKLQNVFDEMIADMLKHEPDLHESRTRIGQSGRIKLSGKIVMRLHPEDGTLPPSRLREATFDTYAKGVWRAADSQFNSLFLTTPESADILPKKPIKYSARVMRNISTKFSRLALPHGSFFLREMGPAVASISTNRLGYASCESEASYLTYVADYGPGATFDAPPTSTDTNVPPSEKALFARTVGELNLPGRSDEDKMQMVEDYFHSNFKYSAEILAQSRGNQSALDCFMTRVRAGHCEYFATATTLLLREAGVSTRYVTGYALQPASRKGDTYLIRARHAHAWVIAYNHDKKIWQEVDSTPPSWDEMNSSDASFWEPLSDFFSNLYFQYSKWRWSQVSYTKYLSALLVPLVGTLVWRIVRNQTRRRSSTGNGFQTIHHDWPGLDSEFFALEKKLHETGLGRLPNEPLLLWRDRLRRELPNELNLDHTFNLHRRLRFDPKGLTANERKTLREEVSRLLAAFEALRQAAASAEDKKDR
jgi:transglutaminase-like putative cysteine protease